MNGFIPTTKSRYDRVVEIPEELASLFVELRSMDPYSKFVLPRLSKWDNGDQAEYLKMELELLGLPEVRFHDLRATWVMLMLNSGASVAQIQQMGGWASLKTMDIYCRSGGIEIKGATKGLRLMSKPLGSPIPDWDEEKDSTPSFYLKSE